jgi:hypothetical protein
MRANVAKQARNRVATHPRTANGSMASIPGRLATAFFRLFAGAGSSSPRGYRREGFPELEFLQTSVGGRSEPWKGRGREIGQVSGLAHETAERRP